MAHMSSPQATAISSDEQYSRSSNSFRVTQPLGMLSRQHSRLCGSIDPISTVSPIVVPLHCLNRFTSATEAVRIDPFSPAAAAAQLNVEVSRSLNSNQIELQIDFESN